MLEPYMEVGSRVLLNKSFVSDESLKDFKDVLSKSLTVRAFDTEQQTFIPYEANVVIPYSKIDKVEKRTKVIKSDLNKFGYIQAQVDFNDDDSMILRVTLENFTPTFEQGCCIFASLSQAIFPELDLNDPAYIS